MHHRAVVAGAASVVLSLASAARPAEFELDVEALVFRVLDVRPLDSPFGAPATSQDLEGLGVRAGAGFAPGDGADAFRIVFQRTEDDFDGSSISDQAVRGGLRSRTHFEATTLDALWRRRIAADGAFGFYSEVGYRYLDTDQSQTIEYDYECRPVCPLFSAGGSVGLRGHGVRAGFRLDRALGGVARFEAAGGLGLLSARERLKQRGPILVMPMASTPVPPDFEWSRSVRRAVMTLDLAARVTVEWKRLGLTVGYRFERWTPGGFLAEGEAVAVDGFTAGLRYRFGEASHEP